MVSTRIGLLLAVGASAVLLTLVLLALLQRLVLSRLTAIIAGMEDLGARLAGGEYEAEPPKRTGPADEIGEFEGFLHAFVKVVGGILKELTARRV